MYVTALIASGYRNLDGEYPLCHPLAVLVGENNAGKSNVIDALRTVLEPELGPRARSWLTADDFAHDGRGERVTDELELEVQLRELSHAEQARMATCLAPSLGPGCARVRLRARLGADGRVVTQYVGGDSDTADLERHARDAVRFTYLHPLRQETDLAFTDLKFERVVRALRAKIGQLHPLEMAEGGLGFNNLLYMAVLLAALADRPDDDSLRVLLVEEPEAHLHPQLQDLLMRYLEDEAGEGTQVIVTSHSPTFASAARPATHGARARW